jgi:tetratricopeptide (TPR) repeat protein
VGRNVDTAPLYADAIARLKAQPEPDHAALGDCLNSRSIHHRDRGDGIASLADAQAAVAQLGTPRPGQRAGAAGFRASLAAAYSLVGQPARAIEIYERELGELERMGRGRTSGALTEMNNLGVLLLRAGQVGRAAVVFQHALDLATGDDAVSRQLLGTNYARALLELGETQEAMRVFEPALASAARSNNHRAYGNTLLSAAPAWCEAGQFKRCAALLADARSLLQPLLPPQHSAFGTLELIDGKLALAQGDAPTARKKLLHAVGLFDAATDRNALRIRALSLLARSEQQQGDAKAAVEHAAAAVAAAREATQAFGSTAWLGEALLAFAGVQRTQGDTASADAASKEALAQLRASLGETAPATLRARAALHGL